MSRNYQMRWDPADVGPTGPINGLVIGDSLASGIASRLAAARPGDTWNEVSLANLGLDNTFGSGSGTGLMGTGSNSFKVRGHDVYYVPGARNVAVILSVAHGDVQDVRDATIDIFGRWGTVASQVRALLWECCLCTVPPTTEYNDPVGSPYTRPARDEINGWLMSGGPGAPIRAGANYAANLEGSGFTAASVGTSGNGGPYLVDGVHLSSAGKDLVVPRISAVIP